MTSRRQRRVAELIQEEISLLIQREVRDPRVGLVTVMHVDVSPDLRLARVYISALAPENEAQTLEALQRASGFLQHELGARVRLRYTPKLEFRVDSSVERSMRIEQLLSEIGTERSPGADD
ncbi:MAG: 30S ribosome-binding factor RbfA [Anaerolineae bacterium]